MTVVSWITAVVAVVALGLSIYNTYVQHRDRTPRVVMSTYWMHPSDAPMVLRGTANPTAPRGKAIYFCDVTNVGKAGVKITQVTIYNPQAPPGKPVPLELPEGEQPRKLDNGDSQTWSISQDAAVEYPPGYGPDRSIRVHVVARDTVGKTYKAKAPEPFPYPYNVSPTG